MKKVLSLMAMLALMTGSAYAKLPAPSPEAKAAADAAKDKAAWGDKVAAYKLCLSQDKTAAYYQKNKEGAKKPTVETPACADPGPYVPPVAAAAPAPAAGAAATPASASGAAPAATPAATPAAPAATTAPAAASATPGATAKK
ncbi:hypothetical protein [Noviherbaspirillum aerium]|uniref:hypothetical protein n=1 Tax=Noviherbaspirillum aerium TaxID=2588497 RepID=UPI00124F6EC2|nr:hypothetical protein [Noviherbaspirillum aerium]